MTPSQGSSIGVAKAPKTFNLPDSSAAGAAVGSAAVAHAESTKVNTTRIETTNSNFFDIVLLQSMNKVV
jgi:hypothetical protein